MSSLGLSFSSGPWLLVGFLVFWFSGSLVFLLQMPRPSGTTNSLGLGFSSGLRLIGGGWVLVLGWFGCSYLVLGCVKFRTHSVSVCVRGVRFLAVVVDLIC